MQSPITILDGALGSELLARDIDTPLPGWSAHALETAPDTIADIHRAYAHAGATIHTTNTFRARPTIFPETWHQLAQQAVSLCRGAIPSTHRVAGSIAPLADCYRPDLSPAETNPTETRRAHANLARVLAEAGCDILLCETFPHPGEALIALDAAIETGVETWLSLTPGYRADLLTPNTLALTAVDAAHRGAAAMLVNCVPAHQASDYLAPLVERVHAVNPELPIGIYANVGTADSAQGWTSGAIEPAEFADLARQWADLGATIIGGCCGTRPAHIHALADVFPAAAQSR